MSKVGYIVKRYPRYSETFIVNEILAHERAGLDLAIFALRPPSDSHFQSIVSEVRAPVHYLDVTSRASDYWSRIAALSDRYPRVWEALPLGRRLHARDVYQAVHLAELATAERITHFHAHFATSAADVARLASRITGIPFTFTAHAKDIFLEEIDLDALGEKFRDAEAVVTVSDYNQRYLQEKIGLAATGVRRIYNGLDVAEFSFLPPVDREPLILGVGRLVEKKGFDVLVEACKVLGETGTDFICTIVGEGEQREDLEKQIRDSELTGSVHLIGPRPRKEVMELIRRSAVVAAPCVVGSDGNRDGLPTVLLEAMALGTPCVSTDVTGIPEVLSNGTTGLLVPQRDARALAEALALLLKDGDTRCRFAANARARIESDFDIAANSAQMRKLFGIVDSARVDVLIEPLTMGRVA